MWRAFHLRVAPDAVSLNLKDALTKTMETGMGIVKINAYVIKLSNRA